MKASSSSSAAETQSFEPKSRNRLKWVVIIGFWTLFGLLNASQTYVSFRMEGFYRPFSRFMIVDLLGWWPWIPATAIVLALGRRFPMERRTWMRALPIHFVAAVLI